MPAADLFELQDAEEWGYERTFFLDNEHRYTKMHRLLRDALGDLRGKRVLDLGCCRGQLLARFEDSEVEGLEIDEEEIALAEKRGIPLRRGHINSFDGTRMVARLPFDDAAYDIVLAGEIIEHIVDTEGFLREILRLLRPGGAAIVSTPNVLWWKYRLAMLAGRYPDVLESRLRYGDDFGHVRAFSPDVLRSLMEEVGFRDVRVVGKRLGPIASLSKTPAPVARALDRLADRLPKLADDVIALGRA